MTLRALIIASPLFALTACVGYPTLDDGDEPGIPPELNTDCGASDRDFLLGQSISEVSTETLAEYVRVIRPGDAVTRDYRIGRLNIDLDHTDTIVRLWCG